MGLEYIFLNLFISLLEGLLLTLCPYLLPEVKETIISAMAVAETKRLVPGYFEPDDRDTPPLEGNDFLPVRNKKAKTAGFRQTATCLRCGKTKAGHSIRWCQDGAPIFNVSGTTFPYRPRYPQPAGVFVDGQLQVGLAERILRTARMAGPYSGVDAAVVNLMNFEAELGHDNGGEAQWVLYSEWWTAYLAERKALRQQNGTA